MREAKRNEVEHGTGGNRITFAMRLTFAGFLLVAVMQAQTYRVYSFKGGPADGAGPETSLVRDSRGNLYGTTIGGGFSYCAFGCGVVFKISPNGTESILYRFLGSLNGLADGSKPQAGVILDKAGNLYGTTGEGGTTGGSCPPEGCGTVFRLSPEGQETVLHSFLGGADGYYPVGALVADDARNLYGATFYGGTYNNGTLFRISADGSNYTVLHSFVFGTEGAGPTGNLVRDKEGNLYGTAQGGGTSGEGTVFKLDPTGALTVLHTFTGEPDGGWPDAGLVRDSAGNLYGDTTVGGGGTGINCDSVGCGVVFKIDTAGNETILYQFSGGSDGAEPDGGLALDTKGNLYGITGKGGYTGSDFCGIIGCGVVFQVAPNGEERVLHSFGESSNDGFLPFLNGVLISGGSLYGSTAAGGENFSGTVFEMTPR